MASTIVDLPDPFSPTNTVAGPRSRPPSRRARTAGMVAGHWSTATLASGRRAIRRMGGVEPNSTTVTIGAQPDNARDE